MRQRLLYGALAIVIMVVVAACDEKLSDLTGPTPNLEPTFSSIQHEIFDTTDSSGRVACIQCHAPIGGRGAAGGLNLTSGASYAALVGASSLQKPGAIRVIPGEPDNSYLVHKLEGRSDIAGLRMPRTQGPFLTEGQMLVIKRWIALGARND
jgi:Planctomycete cytochrome C